MTAEMITQEDVNKASEKAKALIANLDQVLFGQEELTKLTVTGLLAGGHILLEGLPGLGKTELVKGISQSVALDFKRIQFTPDLLPGDITGNPLLQEKDGVREFIFQEGPIFSNIVLADEINRASPKTQSAMLEAMQEHSVTVMGHTRPLPKPFFVLATQNPIELEGTYSLPEAQLDRFLFKLDIKQGGAEVLERIVLEREMGVPPTITESFTENELADICQLVRRIHMPQVVASYIARLVQATHDEKYKELIRFGASPRAALALATAAKALAVIEARVHCGYKDVEALAKSVLRHRIILDYRAKLEGHTPDSIIQQILESIQVADQDLPKTLTER